MNDGVEGVRTEWGFIKGPAEVVCAYGDAKYGQTIFIEGARERVEIRVTPSGLIRVNGPLKAKRFTS